MLRAPAPPVSAPASPTPLQALLTRRIAESPHGRMPFAKVMELALYHPEHGYYGRGPRRIGREGDFFTSVSVGPLFGRLLAQLARQEWERLGCPADFAIVEQGAHDGQLAADVLAALDIPGCRYCIVEPRPEWQQAQRQRLGDRAEWVESISQAPADAIFLCNELPDAFPVHLVQWNGDSWEECHVDASLEWALAPLSSPELAAEVARLPRDLAVGHRMEIGLAALRWVRELAASPVRGAVFIADYGLDAEEFATRPDGTLRRYHRHQTDDHLLADLGESDLTCHVHFTRLIEEAASHGLEVRDYDLQGRYLTRLAAPWLKSLDGRGLDAATLRQFQSLTHPAIMGRSFRCLVLERAGKNREIHPTRSPD